MSLLTPKDCMQVMGQPDLQMEQQFLTLRSYARFRSKIKAIPNNLYINKAMASPLEKAFQNLVDDGLGDLIRTWDGCFNIRKQRGSSVWSLHSYALALDINAAWNGLGKTPTMDRRIVRCFARAGFDWGGYWQRPDGMHFQLGREVFFAFYSKR